MSWNLNLYAVGTPTLPKSFSDAHALAVFQLLEGHQNVTVPSHVASQLVAAFWIKHVKVLPGRSCVQVALDGTRDEIAKRIPGGAQAIANWRAMYREYLQKPANEPSFSPNSGEAS